MGTDRPKRVVVFVALSALLVASLASAAPLFRENFDGATLDATKWSLDLGDGALSISNGCAVLTCPSGTFPFLLMKDDVLPASGDFSVEIGLSYPSVTGLGIGISPLTGEALISPNGLYLWQD